jgi:hypothetical protein
MIGVLASAAEGRVIREFFHLFKTPWEFCRPGATYDVVICSSSQRTDNSAPLVVVYGASRGAFDSEAEIQILAQRSNATLSYQGDRIPISGHCLILAGPGESILQTEDGETLGVEFASGKRTLVRVGFDLFAEVEQLLERGQPLEHARIPTLDLQIALLRDLIVSHSIPLFEIPPIPAGHNFIVCLTHDVDHPGIRNHRGDHTMFGFLYRATLGSLFAFWTGRKSFRQLVTNWRAAFSLPLVYLGLTTDFWKTLDRYRAIESGLLSTFFVIPRKSEPGRRAPSRRAAKYDLTEIREDIQALVSSGCEVGVHGIDAWNDATKGVSELEEIRAVTGQPEIGVRMHWLYFNEESPALLEKAGFSYDSTNGYNETVGYRAGTTQVFRPLSADRLLELPMHVMDTALFFPDYMNLKPSQARDVLDEMLANCVRFGGVLTVNWHDRSIAPERLWDENYCDLLHGLRDRGAWFATAGQAVSWFRKRRSAQFEITGEGVIKIAEDQSDDELPALELRRHNAVPANLASQSSPEGLDATEIPAFTSEPGGITRLAPLQVQA